MGQLFYETLLSALSSLCFGVLFQVRGKNLVCAMVAGGLAWFGYWVAAYLTGSQSTAYFLATVMTAVYAEVFARILRAPAVVFLAVGIIPIVPGGSIYRTMLLTIRGTPNQALAEGIHTIQIAGAMAVGIAIVSSVVRMLWHQNKTTTVSKS